MGHDKAELVPSSLREREIYLSCKTAGYRFRTIGRNFIPHINRVLKKVIILKQVNIMGSAIYLYPFLNTEIDLFTLFLDPSSPIERVDKINFFFYPIFLYAINGYLAIPEMVKKTVFHILVITVLCILLVVVGFAMACHGIEIVPCSYYII